MKKMEIIIRPSMFDKVKNVLSEMGIHGLNYVEIKGFGRQRGHTEVYRGTTMQVDCLPKTRLEVVLPDAMVENVLNAVVSMARTGQVGDGKIFISDVQDAIRIRTGERGDEALKAFDNILTASARGGPTAPPPGAFCRIFNAKETGYEFPPEKGHVQGDKHRARDALRKKDAENG